MPEVLILNNVLAYIQAARDTHTKVEIEGICSSFYDAVDITAAKEKLCNVANQQLITRKGPNKTASELRDILATFDQYDGLPTFVSHGLNSSPPAGHAAMIEPINQLREELQRLTNEVTALRRGHSKIDERFHGERSQNGQRI